MKTTCRYVLLMLLACAGGGCATPYMTNRTRDAADIFTASVGAGVGVKARIGPLGTGLLLDSPQLGLRGGEWLTRENFANRGEPFPWSQDSQLILVGTEQFLPSQHGQQRHKAYCAPMLLWVNVPIPEPFSESSRAMALALKEQPPARIEYAPMPYLTQIEAVLGLGYTVRLGFNVGELLDFLLGWTTVDIFRDDIEGRPAPPPAPPPARQKNNLQAPGGTQPDTTSPHSGPPVFPGRTRGESSSSGTRNPKPPASGVR